MTAVPDMRMLERVVRYLREETGRALRGRELAGTYVEADPAAGRTVGFWLHRTPMTGPRPVVFEMHGGGFALGDARKGDALRQRIAEEFGVHVVGVEYRLAPEQPFPTQLVDALGTLSAVFSGAYCEVDPAHCYLMGYSAGAMLAAACALAAGARRAGEREVLGTVLPDATCAALDATEPRVAGLALHYPFLDASRVPDDSLERPKDVPNELTRAFGRWYVGEAEAAAPLVSPALAPLDALATLPPTVLVPVEGDPLLPQARLMFERLCEAGNPATWLPVSGMYHGYIEDAADARTYLATTMEATVKARPQNYVQVAEKSVDDALRLLLP